MGRRPAAPASPLRPWPGRALRPAAAALLFALAGCSEPSSVRTPPTDRFVFPAAVAVTSPRAGAPGGPATALLVASGNYDLAYDGATGGTVLSVDPRPAAEGGSAGRPGGALVKLGEGAHVGSLAGELAVVDAATCPGPGAAARPVEALVTTRFSGQTWRLPLGEDGGLGPCAGGGCVVPADGRLTDPFGLALTCRPDGLRRSAFVGYMETATIGDAGRAGWVAEIDLEDPAAPARTVAVGLAGISGMAHDAAADRLYVLTRPLLSAPIYVLDLAPCQPAAAGCPAPTIGFVELGTALSGLDLQAIALSNPQPGMGRRAYVTARLYDVGVAMTTGRRPATDLAGALLVLDLEEDLTGRPSLRLLELVHLGVGLGGGAVRVLPARAGRRDLVVVSSHDGAVTVYDDDRGLVARVLALDGATGAPEVGRGPWGLAVDPALVVDPAGPAARVYVAAVQQGQVAVVDVPLEAPGLAHVLRGAGGPVRIGGLQ